MRLQHDEELAAVERELTFLQANMLKEQKRLESIIVEKMAALADQESEMERLRKQNKKLLTNSKLLAAMAVSTMPIGPEGGRITSSATWVTPLLALTSVAVTEASFTVTLPLATVTVSSEPSRLPTFCTPAFRSPLTTLAPATTWH